MYAKEKSYFIRQLSNKERIMTNKKVSLVMFVVLVSLLLFTVIQNTNAQEAEHENDTTTENIDFLQFYDNELFHWNFNKFNGNIFSIPQINDLDFVGKLNEQWVEEQKKMKDDLLNYKLYSENQFNYWKMQEELKEYHKNHPQFIPPKPLSFSEIKPPNLSELKIPSNSR